LHEIPAGADQIFNDTIRSDLINILLNIKTFLNGRAPTPAPHPFTTPKRIGDKLGAYCSEAD
jgi:hypothetical protein